MVTWMRLTSSAIAIYPARDGKPFPIATLANLTIQYSARCTRYVSYGYTHLTDEEEEEVRHNLIHGLANPRRSELHITHELRMRVQALEQLIKSGLTLDSDQATFMATETVHQATRAAQSGSQDATNALAQLTRSSIGSGIGGMSSEAQNSLLMDVLQQVS